MIIFFIISILLLCVLLTQCQWLCSCFSRPHYTFWGFRVQYVLHESENKLKGVVPLNEFYSTGFQYIEIIFHFTKICITNMSVTILNQQIIIMKKLILAVALLSMSLAIEAKASVSSELTSIVGEP